MKVALKYFCSGRQNFPLRLGKNCMEGVNLKNKNKNIKGSGSP